MKEKVEVKGNKIEVKENETREKATGFLAMWKEFWNSDSKELSETEEIMQDKSLSKEMKELLIKSLKNADSIVKPTDRVISYKKKDVRVSARESAEKALKENPIHVDTKAHIDTETGKIVKNSKRTGKSIDDR